MATGVIDLRNQSPAAGMSAGQAYQQMTRQMWADYVTQFMPFENRLIEYATDPGVVSGAMAEASQMVNQQFDAQQGATQRRLRGLGLQLDGDEQRAVDRSTQISRSLADVTAQNQARVATTDRQRSVLGNPAPGLPQL